MKYLPIFSLVLLRQTLGSLAFQTMPSVTFSSMACNRRLGTNKVASPARQQRQQQGMPLLSNQSTIGRKELDNSRGQRPALNLPTVAAVAAFFAAVFSKSAPARAAATIVMPALGTEGGVILPLLGIMNMKNILFPIKVNRGSVIFLFAISTLALVVATTTFVRSMGDGYVPATHVSRLLHRGVNNDNSDEKSDLDLGLPKEIDWGTYSHSIIEPLTAKEKKKVNGKRKRFSFHLFNLFDQSRANDEDDRKVDESQIERAARFFLEQKYKLHHHPVHVSHSRYEVPTYLQTLAINVLERHNNMPKDYLHTLSTAKLSTWDAYQHQLDKVNPASEVDELKQGISNLQDLMQMEQSMYHTSNHVLKLAIDAHHDEMQHVSTHEQLKEFDERLSIQDELKAFDKKAMDYEEILKDGGDELKTLKNLIPNEEDCKATNFPV